MFGTIFYRPFFCKSLESGYVTFEEEIASLAGHKRPGTDDDHRIIKETRQYIRDFDKLAESTDNARELYDQMLKLYPNWLDPHVLWLGARAAKGEGAL